MPAPKGARYAAKSDADRKVTGIDFRLTQSEYDLITAAAGTQKPAAWARAIVLKAASVEAEKLKAAKD